MAEGQEERIRQLEARLAECEARLAGYEEDRRRVLKGPSVIVPPSMAPIFEKAEVTVGEYFEHLDRDPTRGHIDIHGERYVLIRAAALSANFLESVARLYADKGPEASMAIGREFLFDIAHIIGLDDAKSFQAKLGLHDPVEKLSAGPVHFSHTGWALVDISPESRPSPDDEYYLIYDHPYSFEADSWIRSGKSPPGPVCVMNAGYSSGWCEASFGLPLTAVEVLCKARGDACCRFIMAPPHRIEGHVERYLAGLPGDVRRGIVYEVPTFFDRKKSEELLEASERRFRLAAQVASDLIYEWDCRSDGLRWFGDIARHLGHAEGGLGHDLASFVSLLHPADQARVSDAMQRYRAATAPIFTEYRIHHQDGSWRTLEDRSIPILGADGRPERWIGVCTDVTEQRKMESERIQTSKLESLGVLAGGIAHDFNNMLTGIRGNLDLAVMMTGDVELLEILGDCRSACERTKDLTKQLLTFAKGGRPIRKMVDVAKVVREATEFSLRGTTVKAAFDCAPGLPEVFLDPGQIGQVAQNLAINAAQAMPAGGSLEVSIGRVPAAASGSDVLELRFRDRGQGIPAAIIDRIFDPYFTTKSGGSGIGLATCFSIVRNHQGTITVDSEPGAGATFTIQLPIVQREDGSEAGAKAGLVHGAGRVLVMDDDESIRKLVVRMLHRIGYEATATAHGHEAVAAFRGARERGEPFGAVILDLTVPGGMGGYEALRAIRELDPRVLAVVASGYTDTAILDDYQAHGFHGRLHKPFTLEELSAVLTAWR